MPARARVLRGVAVGRAVAAQRSATLLAGPQTDPLRAHLPALGALPLFRVPHRYDRADVGAGSVGAHCPPPIGPALGERRPSPSIPGLLPAPRASISRPGRP